MSYRNKKKVLESFKQRVINSSNERYKCCLWEAYLGTNPYTRKPVRLYARSLTELKKKVDDFYKRLDRGGEPGVELTRFQAFDAKQAIDMLRESGKNISLLECVRTVLACESTKAASKAVTIEDAYAQYAKSIQDKSAAYQKDVRLRVGAWVDAFGTERPLGEVSAPEVKKYLMDRLYRQGDIGSWVTYNNHLGNIKSFLSWCASREQGFIAENPLDGMKKIVIPYRQPEYMKAAHVEGLFRELWNRRETQTGRADLACAVLSFFCGMRQSEIERVPLGEHAVRISIEERTIRVGIPKGVSRGIRPRAFTIPDQAIAWMTAFDFMDGATTRNKHFRRHLVDAADAAKAKLTKNAGRHTFITMFEAVHHDANALTAIVGNTDDVRSKSYNGVELRSEGEAYFRMLPPGNDAENGVSATPAADS